MFYNGNYVKNDTKNQKNTKYPQNNIEKQSMSSKRYNSSSINSTGGTQKFPLNGIDSKSLNHLLALSLIIDPCAALFGGLLENNLMKLLRKLLIRKS